jgi:Uncharacterized protein family UPF0029
VRNCQGATQSTTITSASQGRSWVANANGEACASANHGSSCRHWTLAQPCESLLEAQCSKFFAFAWHCTSPEQALQLVSDASDPKASHNCFAFKIGDNFRSTDDGEPGGTAGRPILNAIETEELDEVCVLVIRFFGGTKLGAGGLVRAYGGTARQCLQEAKREFVVAKVIRPNYNAKNLGTDGMLTHALGASSTSLCKSCHNDHPDHIADLLYRSMSPSDIWAATLLKLEVVPA